jgi:glutamate dehydrogenase/leucine dehydrogenase
MKRDEVNERLFKHMAEAWDSVQSFAKEKNISYRTAAFAIGIKRILEAEHSHKKLVVTEE